MSCVTRSSLLASLPPQPPRLPRVAVKEEKEAKDRELGLDKPETKKVLAFVRRQTCNRGNV